MSWGNWTFGSGQRQQAADLFLRTGNINTIFGGSQCFSSGDCGSGYTCAGGRCVPKVSQQSSDGSTSGCGEGSGGGPCNSLTTTNHSATNRTTGETAYGDVIRYHSDGSMSSYQWVPVYAADGCTIAGCSLEKCGSEGAVDCPGTRSCRYDAYGTINCFCGEPQQQGCSSFCTSYSQSFGGEAAGCSGLACDECSFCEEIFVSVSGNCRPLTNGSAPCHCDLFGGPECTRCNENGTRSFDPTSCQRCVTITNTECPGCDATVVNQTCCYTLDQWESGPSPVNRCQAEIANRCDEICDKPGSKPRLDPCQGDCEDITAPCGGTDSYGNPTPDCGTFTPTPGNPLPDHPNAPDGYKNVVTGWIKVGDQASILFKRCDMTNVPESCKECDCNCHNDCPSCQLCGADGTCYPDPNCSGNFKSRWYLAGAPFTYYGCAYSPDYGGGCVYPSTGATGTVNVTSDCGPLPHSLVLTTEAVLNPYGPCVTGSSRRGWRIKDGNGNWISGEFLSGGVSGTWCGGPDPGREPSLIETIKC